MQKQNAKRMKSEYEAAMGQAAAVAFISVVRRHPDVKLGDIFDLAKEKGLEHLTVQQVFLEDDFLDFAKAPKKALAAPKKSQVKKRAVSLRTVAQREEYRLAMIDAMSKDWMAAPDIGHDGPGGSPMQIRNTLNSLIEEGIVQYKGQARGTRYRLTKKGLKLKKN